ncbi:MAG: metallophosphoesterase family protein [Anaerolineae bacterium]|nr:metallophosphatase family protein [Thermoflexales bacterium]MDW8408291.1 metallophosphoesterase family protein [Anaerolineae bacterium]
MAWRHIIGVLSDTHVPHRLSALPPAVLTCLQGCTLILHAGDVEDPTILEPLQAIAPLYAVRGNVHWQYSTGTHDHNLPAQITVSLGGHTIWMTHGHLNFGYTMLDKLIHLGSRPRRTQINRAIIRRLARTKPRGADIVVFGHSHQLCGVWQDGALFYNPGAVCVDVEAGGLPTVGRILINEAGQIHPEWIVVPYS